MSVALEITRRPVSGFRLSLSDLFAVARQRRALARMDATQLRDLGISADDAETEAQRPFWDLPAHFSR